MELKYNYWTGSVNNVLEHLNRSIGQYKQYKKIKIGKTNNPKRRVSEHSRNNINWDKMVVLYKTTSVNFVKKLETILVDNNWDYIENEISGGGGPDGEGDQYIYILLKK